MPTKPNQLEPLNLLAMFEKQYLAVQLKTSLSFLREVNFLLK